MPLSRTSSPNPSIKQHMFTSLTVSNKHLTTQIYCCSRKNTFYLTWSNCYWCCWTKNTLVLQTVLMTCSTTWSCTVQSTYESVRKSTCPSCHKRHKWVAAACVLFGSFVMFHFLFLCKLSGYLVTLAKFPCFRMCCCWKEGMCSIFAVICRLNLLWALTALSCDVMVSKNHIILVDWELELVLLCILRFFKVNYSSYLFLLIFRP